MAADMIVDVATTAQDLQLMVRNLKPDIVSDMFETLQNEQYQAQLTAYSSRLTKIINTLQSTGGGSLFENQGVSRMFSHIAERSSSLSNELLSINQQQTTIFKAQQAVKELFIIEHEIMDFLTKGRTETSTYSIFIHGEGADSSKIYQGKISAQDIYGELQGDLHIGGANIVSLTESGDKIKGLDFQKGDLRSKFGSQFKELSQTDYGRVGSLANEAISSMRQQQVGFAAQKETSERLQRELEAFRQQLHEQYERLKALRVHKGWRRNEEYLKLRAIFESDTSTMKAMARESRSARTAFNKVRTRHDDLTKLLYGDVENLQTLYDFYTKNAPLNITSDHVDRKRQHYTIRTSWNRGHIMEALVRLQEDSGGALSSKAAFEASLGRDIWWAQGDVQSSVDGSGIQVKSMLSQEYESIQIASLWSVMELANSLLTLLNNYRNLPMQAQMKIASIVDEDLNQAQNNVAMTATQIAKKISADIMSSFE